jgi:hypothetical protein
MHIGDFNPFGNKKKFRRFLQGVEGGGVYGIKFGQIFDNSKLLLVNLHIL